MSQRRIKSFYFYQCKMLLLKFLYTYTANIMNKAVMRRTHVVLFFFVGLCRQQHVMHKQHDVNSKKITKHTTGKAARNSIP